jgi:hypothetical protein
MVRHHSFEYEKHSQELIQSCSKQKVVKDITQGGTALWFTYKINHVLLRLQIEPTGYSRLIYTSQKYHYRLFLGLRLGNQKP